MKTVKGETTCVSIILLGNVISMEDLICVLIQIMQSSIKCSWFRNTKIMKYGQNTLCE